MKKRILALLLALVMVLALAACSGGGKTAGDDSEQPPAEGNQPATSGSVTLVYAEVNPLDTIVGQLAQDFKDKVEELSGGQVTIDLQPNGVLGNEAQILDGILGGGTSVDISRISAFALSSYGCTKATLLSLPYTFVSRDHFWAFANSDLAQEFLNEPQEVGLPLRGLCYGEEGFRHFFFKTPVSGIDDLKGQKIRVSEDPVMTGLVKGLGASPTVVNFNELYSGLQTGVCDGAEQPIANYKSNAFQEVAPNLLLDGHTLGAVQLVITDNAWNKLSEEQQGWVMEAAAYASNKNAENSQAAEDEVLQELIDEGINVVDVPDKSAWAEACADVVTANLNGNDDLYQQILDMAP